MSETPPGAPVVDAVDRRILHELSKDARLSIRALARNIGMSAGAVGERIERLETRGVIRGYRVDIDPAAVGRGLEVLVGIELSQHQAVLESMNALRQLPAVRSVELVTGRWDLVVRLAVADEKHLREVLTDRIWRIPSLRHSESMLVLQSVTVDDLLEALGDQIQAGADEASDAAGRE